MTDRKWAYAAVITMVALAVGFVASGSFNLRAQSGGAVQEPILAPDFTLTNILDGERLTLSDLRGKVVLINFWATWCGPCRREIPDLIRIYTNHQADGLVILGISLDNLKTDQIRSFAQNYKIPYPVLHGTQTELGDVSRAYGGINAIPTTFLIDRDGYIREMYVGARSERVFLQDIKKYL